MPKLYTPRPPLSRLHAFPRHATPTPPAGPWVRIPHQKKRKGGPTCRLDRPSSFIGQAGFYPPPKPAAGAAGSCGQVCPQLGVAACHRHATPTPPAGPWVRIPHQKKEGRPNLSAGPPFLFHRASGIRTHDPLHPMQVRYQTALLPECLLLSPFRESAAQVYAGILKLSTPFFHDMISAR